jgi:hypothetical protein
MMFTTLIALAALIPGLGFLILGRWRSALITWLSLGVIAFLPLSVQVDQMCFAMNVVLILLFWALQWIRTFKLARIIGQLRQGKVSLLPKADRRTTRLEPGFTVAQWQHQVLGSRLRASLGEGETLLAWVQGEPDYRGLLWGNRTCCLSLLKRDLLVGEFGAFDFPDTIRRVPLMLVNMFSDQVKGGMLLWVVYDEEDGRRKSILLRIHSTDRGILQDFNQKAHVAPMFKQEGQSR